MSSSEVFEYLKNENNLINFCQYLLNNFHYDDVQDIPYDLRKTANGETKAVRINYLRLSSNSVYTIVSSSKEDLVWSNETIKYEKILSSMMKRSKNLGVILG